MKKLADGTEVSARTYYYLLDFNDRYNWETMARMFNKNKLSNLNIEEYKELFDHATDVDKITLILA